MATRMPSHQLSGGLYVSGRPEQHKERQPTMASRSVPYTGGDVKKSGELGKMFDIPLADPSSKASNNRPSPSSHNSGSLGSASSSGPLPKSSSSGPVPKKSSGLLSLQPTGLITSGPLSSTSSSSGPRRSGKLEPSSSAKPPATSSYGASVTHLVEDVKFRFSISRPVLWVSFVLFAIGLVVGAFMMVTVKKPFILIIVAAVLVAMLLLVAWNSAFGRRGLLRFLRRYPDAELRGARDGQYIKVTGIIWVVLGLVVTCGSIPLASSFQQIPRCIYVCTELQEYRGLTGKSANPDHHHFTWGLRHAERHVADFYISDFQSGLRALVKAGYGAKVATFVKPATVIDITKENRQLSPSFLRWLAEHNLSSDDRVMRLKEGFVKEGNTVSVMGVVQRHDNVLMIVPPHEPVSTGCQWTTCLFPPYLEGLILMCDETQNADVIPV